MKKAVSAAAMCVVAGYAWADDSGGSSVALYGLISTGIGYVSNAGGQRVFEQVSGANQNNRWGLSIKEDLGGGTSAVARLESGFSGATGASGQNGRLFGREASVGLSDTTYGTLTVGRQYDATWDFITPIASAAGGLLMAPGDVENIFGSWRFSNSVKYRSPEIAGFSGEALYAFSNSQEFSVNRAFNVGLRYAHGPGQVAVMYTQLDQPGMKNPDGAVSSDYSGAPAFLYRQSPQGAATERQRNFFVAGQYKFSSTVTLNAAFNTARFSYTDGSSFALDNYHLSASWLLTPKLTVAGSYIYSTGRWRGVDANGHWNAGQLLVDYAFSKRTDVYAYYDLVRSSGPLKSASGVPMAVADTYTNTPSGSHTQNFAVVGIRHRF